MIISISYELIENKKGVNISLPLFIDELTVSTHCAFAQSGF
ncbi:hypothetical protein CSC04_0105 [Enterobacter roggenkampii]|nr:hypothetical protein CSC04_0105 [Enterobacter roggenkampii]